MSPSPREPPPAPRPQPDNLLTGHLLTSELRSFPYCTARIMRRCAGWIIVCAIACTLAVSGCGSSRSPTGPTFELGSGDLAGTRAASDSPLRADTVGRLKLQWRFPLRDFPSSAGIFASTPVVKGNTVYIEDLDSTVFALNRATGKVRWITHFLEANGGPNGLAVSGGRVYGATVDEAFAVSAQTGKKLWQHHLTRDRSSSSTSPRSSGRASYFWERSATRRSGAAPSTPSTHEPARSGGSSTRSRTWAPPVTGRRRRNLVPGLGR